MTFREAVLAAAKTDPKLYRRLTRAIDRSQAEGRFDGRVFWGVAEKIVARRYRRDTGHVGKIDWAAALDWLIENLPAILKIVLTILAFF